MKQQMVKGSGVSRDVVTFVAEPHSCGATETPSALQHLHHCCGSFTQVKYIQDSFLHWGEFVKAEIVGFSS